MHWAVQLLCHTRPGEQPARAKHALSASDTALPR
jgi:hypothetical protein